MNSLKHRSLKEGGDKSETWNNQREASGHCLKIRETLGVKRRHNSSQRMKAAGIKRTSLE